MGYTPNIRFKGFTDAWEQRKLEDFLSVSKQKNRDERYDKEDVLSVSGDYGIVNQIEFQGRSFAGASVANYGVVETGDVVYTKSPLRANPYGIIKTNKGNTGIVSTLYAVYKPKKNVDSEFVQVYFEQDTRMNSYMHPLVNKGAKNDMKVSAENALKGGITFPKIEEQRQISAYFNKLDKLITLHQRKCDEIIELKKYMLQKMFPQNNQKVPELRFVGFTGDWERHKFSNIVMEKLTNGVMNQQSDFQTDVKHINVINMYVFDKIHVEDLTYSSCDNIAVEKCNVEVGDIFLTRSSLKPEGIAEPNVLLDDGCFVFDDHLIRMKVNKEKYDPLFTKILLSTKPVKKQFIAKSKQNAFTTIGQEDIAESEGLFPSLSEQQEIGKYFSNIDNLITLHQHKCDALKEIKKFMLQNMFP